MLLASLARKLKSLKGNTNNHNYDPLGKIFEAIETSQIIMKYNIPIEISLQICSYIEYYETTLDAKVAEGVLTFSPNDHANELCIVIKPPYKTLLPSKSYILSDIIFPFKDIRDDRKYMAFIQIFDEDKKPGETKIIYKSDELDTLDLHKINDNKKKEKPQKMCKLSSINIELKCGLSYLFYIRELNYQNKFVGITTRLINTMDGDNESIIQKLKFCSTVFWYPAECKQYEKPRYLNFFKISFICKI